MASIIFSAGYVNAASWEVKVAAIYIDIHNKYQQAEVLKFIVPDNKCVDSKKQLEGLEGYTIPLQRICIFLPLDKKDTIIFGYFYPDKHIKELSAKKLNGDGYTQLTINGDRAEYQSGSYKISARRLKSSTK